MSFNLLMICLIPTFVAGTFVPDKLTREFRRSFLHFKTDSLQVVDQVFFNVYNTFAYHITESIKPVIELQESWGNFCENVTKSTISRPSRRKWQKSCSNVQKKINETLLEREKALAVFYSGNLLNPTPLAAILEDIIIKVELHMATMWDIHVKNSSCVSPMLSNYFPSFLPIIDNIVFMANATIAEIPRIFNELQIIDAEKGRQALYCVSQSKDCLTLKNTEKCLSKSVRKLNFN
jgi:hypothetical protein